MTRVVGDGNPPGSGGRATGSGLTWDMEVRGPNLLRCASVAAAAAAGSCKCLSFKMSHHPVHAPSVGFLPRLHPAMIVVVAIRTRTSHIDLPARTSLILSSTVDRHHQTARQTDRQTGRQKGRGHMYIHAAMCTFSSWRPPLRQRQQVQPSSWPTGREDRGTARARRQMRPGPAPEARYRRGALSLFGRCSAGGFRENGVDQTPSAQIEWSFQTWALVPRMASE